MAWNFLRKIFRKKRTYVVLASEGDVSEPSPDHPNFQEENTEAQLLKASRLSPLLWRHLFPLSPPHPTDHDCKEADGVRYTRCSSTSSAGYGSQSSSDGSTTPRLGASSFGYSSGDSADVEVLSSKETSPVMEVKTVRFRECDYSHTPTTNYVVQTPGTLPPKTPHRSSFLRREMRTKRHPVSYGELEKIETEESFEAKRKSFMSESDLTTTPHTMRNMFTPGTLPPKTPYRDALIRQEMRKRPERIYPVLDLEMSSAEHEESSSSETKTMGSIWGEPVYSPASLNDILQESPSSPEDSPCTHFYEGAFVRHENRKHSLRRKPSAPVSGRVKQMIQFFENDSARVEIPRRLDLVPAEYMRSCPQMDCNEITPSRPSHGHVQSGITHSSDRCIRCPSYYRTPNSRRSFT